MILFILFLISDSFRRHIAVQQLKLSTCTKKRLILNGIRLTRCNNELFAIIESTVTSAKYT